MGAIPVGAARPPNTVCNEVGTRVVDVVVDTVKVDVEYSVIIDVKLWHCAIASVYSASDVNMNTPPHVKKQD